MKSKLFARREGGFTLVELLIVIAIIGVLMGLALAGMRFAQRRARDLERQNTIRNIQAAVEAYYIDKKIYPAGTTTTADLINTTLAEYLTSDFELPNNVTPAHIGYVTTSDNLSYLLCIYKEGVPQTDANTITSGTGDTLLTQCRADITATP